MSSLQDKLDFLSTLHLCQSFLTSTLSITLPTTWSSRQYLAVIVTILTATSCKPWLLDSQEQWNRNSTFLSIKVLTSTLFVTNIYAFQYQIAWLDHAPVSLYNSDTQESVITMETGKYVCALWAISQLFPNQSIRRKHKRTKGHKKLPKSMKMNNIRYIK